MIVEFSKAVSLLLSLCLIQGFIVRYWRPDDKLGAIVSGVLFGAICLIGMMTPIEVAPGVIFDARSVVLSLAGFVGGPITAGIAGLMAASYRLWLGGSGAAVGVSVIVACVLLGLIYRHAYKRGWFGAGIGQLLVFGFLVHIVEIYLFTFLPDAIVDQVMGTIAVPMLVTFTPATAALGSLLLAIDAQVKTERALADSEQRFRDIAEAASDWFWEMDADLRFTYISDRITEITGFPADAMIGKSRGDNIQADSQEFTKQKWRDHFETLKHRKPFRDFEYYVRAPDNEIVHVSTSGVPVFDETGVFRGYRGTGRNVSRRKAAQREIRRLASIIETTDDAVVLLTPTGTITYWNTGAERIFGYDASEATGNSVVMLAPDVAQDGKGALAEILISGERARGVETQGRRKDGTLFDFSVTVSRVPDAEGNTTSIAAIIRDVSELQETRKQLFQAQKMEATGRIAGGIAHDFNNLLAVIMGNAELIPDTDDKEMKEQLVAEIVNASERGSELTRRLLSFARKSVLAPETTEPNEIISHMTNLFERVLPASINLDMRLDSGLPNICVDVSFLESALLNLVINARDAMPDGGRIVIETKSTTMTADDIVQAPEEIVQGEYVMVSVADSGTGIATEDIAKVVEPFFTTKGPDKGSGLGLAMVHGFARQSLGALRIDSEISHGTTIKLFLPAIATRSAARETATVQNGNAKQKPTGTVLVVEDEPAILDIVTRTLSTAGFVVLQASSGDEAIRKFASTASEIDVLLTDIVMPGQQQGPSLARSMSALSDRLVTVYMSGFPNETALLPGELGKDARFLMKPIRRDVLLEFISLAVREAQRSTHSKTVSA